MFDSIALKYDFLNHFLSFGIDRFWRRKAIRTISAYKKNPVILDVATGTADLAIEAMRIDPVKITGIDISTKMLEEGRKKIERKGLVGKIELVCADSENIPFDNNSFDVAMVAFGVRNFTDPLKGLSEMKRVLNENGMIMVLEFSKPKGVIFRTMYDFYSLGFLPLVGRLVSKDKSAYRYLPDSIRKFPNNELFLDMLQKAGFADTRQIRLSGGIASIYTGFSTEQKSGKQ
jgi:demethylmenaquinone methyltransferase/2-methoxy-6-polyprenyl-1,4-benzoquinol methylase